MKSAPGKSSLSREYGFNVKTPITYRLDGKQYIAVAAGGSKIWGFRQGGAVVVFGLAD